jgi:hypothetical protein
MKKITRYLLLFTTFIIGSYAILKAALFPYFAHRHNENILRGIKAANAKSYTSFSAFIQDIEKETDWQVLVTSGYRTEDEQERLNQKDSRNADAGQSKHNFGKAIDINLYKNTWRRGTWLMKASDKKRWYDSGILKIAQKHGLKWGGSFKSYYDPVHFETE